MSFWFSKEDIIYLHSTIVMKTGGEDAKIPLQIGFVQRLTKGV